MTLAVATQVIGDVMTSSPAPMPATRNAASIVAVPFAKASTRRPPNRLERAASNSSTLGPEVIQPEARTSPTAAAVAASIHGRAKGMKDWSLTSGHAQLRATMKTPSRITAMPAQRIGPRASPNSHQAAAALTT